MGKSPGKWIKTVLFGKKSSKSNLSKGGANVEKKATTEAAPGDFNVSPSVISDVTFQSTNREGGTGEAEKYSPGQVEPAKLGGDLLDDVGLYPTDDAERLKFEEAATKAQAAFRGYLARRAFRALKGIIRLQALIRGHLVRRQAVATLRCMQSVVKLQALARGRRVRLSNPDLQLPQNYRLREILDSNHVNLLQVSKVSRSEKLAANAFARKLLASLPTAMALSLQYDMDEPNASWNWLERWSLLRFWEPLVPLRKARDSKSTVKQAKPTVETEPGKSRRTRKVSAVANGDHNTLSALEAEKPKRSSRKLVNHQGEVQPEQAQNELERVKRSLRKVTSSTTPLPEKSEVEIEKPQQNARKVTTATISDALESETPKLSEQQPSDLVADKVDETEVPTQPLIMDEAGYVASIVEPHPVENNPEVEIKASVEEDLGIKDEQTSKENQKTRRRKSLSTKQEYPENTSQNTSSLPSYMAATESAKAKLRAQAAAKLIEEGLENGNVRRHSLPPPPANGKPSPISPRLQKPAQANGKGGSKSSKTQLAPKDEKALPGWRR